MQNDVVSYFLRLIAIDSESGNERGMIDALKIDLAELGCIVEEDGSHKETGGNAGNLYAYFPGDINKDPILLCAHVDTVSPGNGIKASIVNNKIVSDGNTILGSDDKSGVAEIMIGLKRIKDSGQPHAPVEILFTVSEETGLLGAKYFDKSKLRSKFGYAFDSHRVEDLVLGAPSQNSFEVIFHGREAHAGVEPEKGLNAIVLASHALINMPMGRIDHESTCSVGLIKGGEATNIVPNKVIIEGEARSHDPKKLQELCARIEASIREALEPFVADGANFEFKTQHEYHSFRLAEDAEAVQLAKNTLEKLGIKANMRIGGGGSDANILNAAGLPMLLAGTGMDNVHTVHECIEIQQLYLGADFVEQLIKSYSEV